MHRSFRALRPLLDPSAGASSALRSRALLAITCRTSAKACPKHYRTQSLMIFQVSSLSPFLAYLQGWGDAYVCLFCIRSRTCWNFYVTGDMLDKVHIPISSLESVWTERKHLLPCSSPLPTPSLRGPQVTINSHLPSRKL
jgi:hypothetical protein